MLVFRLPQLNKFVKVFVFIFALSFMFVFGAESCTEENNFYPVCNWCPGYEGSEGACYLVGWARFCGTLDSGDNGCQTHEESWTCPGGAVVYSGNYSTTISVSEGDPTCPPTSPNCVFISWASGECPSGPGLPGQCNVSTCLNYYPGSGADCAACRGVSGACPGKELFGSYSTDPAIICTQGYCDCYRPPSGPSGPQILGSLRTQGPGGIIYKLDLISVADAISLARGLVKVKTPTDTLAAWLVETSDSNSSPVRLMTPGGIRKWHVSP